MATYADKKIAAIRFRHETNVILHLGPTTALTAVAIANARSTSHM